jgi:recombination protein RecR
MMAPVDKIVALLSRLPGVGEKTAMRMALAILDRPDDYVEALAASLRSAKKTMGLCNVCCDMSSTPTCSICADARRDPKVICVVALSADRMAFEKAAVFKGRYHVLQGVIDPPAGMLPSTLKIQELLRRLEGGEVREVIVATSPTVEGNITAVWLQLKIIPLGVEVSRIAVGVGVGTLVEHADQATLSQAFEGRQRVTCL